MIMITTTRIIIIMVKIASISGEFIIENKIQTAEILSSQCDNNFTSFLGYYGGAIWKNNSAISVYSNDDQALNRDNQ